jgi:hypothetical protein
MGHAKRSCGPSESSACMHVWLKTKTLTLRFNSLYPAPSASLRSSPDVVFWAAFFFFFLGGGVLFKSLGF